MRFSGYQNQFYTAPCSHPNHRLLLLFPNTLRLISLSWRSRLQKILARTTMSVKRTWWLFLVQGHWLKRKTTVPVVFNWWILFWEIWILSTGETKVEIKVKDWLFFPQFMKCVILLFGSTAVKRLWEISQSVYGRNKTLGGDEITSRNSDWAVFKLFEGKYPSMNAPIRAVRVGLISCACFSFGNSHHGGTPNACFRIKWVCAPCGSVLSVHSALGLICIPLCRNKGHLFWGRSLPAAI